MVTTTPEDFKDAIALNVSKSTRKENVECMQRKLGESPCRVSELLLQETKLHYSVSHSNPGVFQPLSLPEYSNCGKSLLTPLSLIRFPALS